MQVLRLEVAVTQSERSRVGDAVDMVEKCRCLGNFFLGRGPTEQKRQGPVEPFPRLRVEERAIVDACEGGDLVRLGMERLQPRDEVASFEVSLAPLGRGDIQQRLVSEILDEVEACDRVVKRAFRYRKTRFLKKCSHGLKRRFRKPLRRLGLGLGVSNPLSVRRISFESCD